MTRSPSPFRALNLVAFGRRRPALLGLNGLVLLLVLLAIALNASRLPFFTGTTYRAEFSDASGLQIGEEVRVAGVKVGQVRDIELRDDVVVVTFDVDGPRLGEQTSAGIEVKTLLGQHYLSVTPAGDGRLAEGATIPLSRTTTPLNVVPAFQQLTTEVGELDVDQLAQALGSITDVVEASAPEMRDTLVGLGRLSETVASRDRELRELFGSAEDVTGVLAARNDDLAALLTSSEQVLATLDSRRAVIEAIIRDAAGLAAELRGLVADNRATLRPALARINRVLTVLRANRDNIDEALRATALYGREFSSVGGTGRFFDGAITTPRGFAVCSFEPDTALSEILDPILSELNEVVNGSSAPCIPLGPAPGGEN